MESWPLNSPNPAVNLPVKKVNLTPRQSVVPLVRKTWPLAQTEHALLMHV
ncbi:MAG: hypothetical protein JW953_14965 [Anaerolineae bacterium]|nr:hypothetical protein [Anaerolineae bacterium]